MGRGYVTIDKIKEDQTYVWYSFETPLYEEEIIDFSKGS